MKSGNYQFFLKKIGIWNSKEKKIGKFIFEEIQQNSCKN